MTLDSKALPLSVSRNSTSTNLMTISHETGHVAFHMPDLYGYGVGALDIAGPTCGPPESLLFRTSAGEKMPPVGSSRRWW